MNKLQRYIIYIIAVHTTSFMPWMLQVLNLLWLLTENDLVIHEDRGCLDFVFMGAQLIIGLN